MPDFNTVLVTVKCPECLNLNRKARRACRNCNHMGVVRKWVPKDDLPDDLMVEEGT